MYRVYLADDNDLFRESLIKTISWEKIDCMLIGDARDGDTAGREILELKPDIVLMDIRMPGKRTGFRGESLSSPAITISAMLRRESGLVSLIFS